MDDFPKPKFITGGCLCGALRYRIDFPDNHDFIGNSTTCQCTQDRRNTGSFFFPAHRVPRSALTWLTSNTSSSSSSSSPSPPAAATAAAAATAPTAPLREYKATPSAARGFCGTCGSFMYWRHAADPEEEEDGEPSGMISITIGTVDPLYLFGERGADGKQGEEEEEEGEGGEGGGGEKGQRRQEVPEGGFGVALANAGGGHQWCRNEIPGVTDRMEYLRTGGKRFDGDG